MDDGRWKRDDGRKEGEKMRSLGRLEEGRQSSEG
jgi:hypothetical protein